jgi:hypothetical protein
MFIQGSTPNEGGSSLFALIFYLPAAAPSSLLTTTTTPPAPLSLFDSPSNRGTPRCTEFEFRRFWLVSGVVLGVVLGVALAGGCGLCRTDEQTQKTNSLLSGPERERERGGKGSSLLPR